LYSHISPSNSRYKFQSQKHEKIISTSPVRNILCNRSQVSSQDLILPESNSPTVMWAVSNISSVPPGSVIINPQTNQPYTNQDGSLYRFDPKNLPKFCIKNSETQGMLYSL
jgi:encore-like protein